MVTPMRPNNIYVRFLMLMGVVVCKDKMPEAMTMLTFLARMKVKAEREEEFISLAGKLTERTLANETGVRAYQFYKLRDEERGYAVFEAFVDDAAEEAHRHTDHFNEFAPPLLECLDGTYVREFLDPLA